MGRSGITLAKSGPGVQVLPFFPQAQVFKPRTILASIQECKAVASSFKAQGSIPNLLEIQGPSIIFSLAAKIFISLSSRGLGPHPLFA